ncbi:tetratricopeptide repeat-containing glycosyltransferase family 2 protein [Paenibacillus mendelii]|uniref:Glycosyltransferase n=1 Tax=Paenibacillus mendelii TaxID=206163 RepID=A0ABV6J3S2_9BACL|nr:glycosyltransferase family 2 protein [Paenibacillus mendelii]MCQ6563563.1 glycosyltransferase family 2 protein [Paenibacillus mendelii]
MKHNKLALVMIVRNEEIKLPRCLQSAAPYVDEIIVVDTGSNDGTKALAEGFGARVFDYEWNNHFGDARNYALDQSTADWNLILDADEWITEIDMQVLKRFMLEGDALGRIQILSETEEQGEKGISRGFITRLLTSDVRFKGRIHEQADTDLKRVNVPITVHHDGYRNTDKSGRNIPLLLSEVEQSPDDSYTNYQLGKEYQGIGQFDTACIYYERAYTCLHGLERYAPNVTVQYLYALKETKRFEEALRIIGARHDWLERFPDYHFACGIFYLDLILSNPDAYAALLPEIEAAYRRCLAIGETDQYDSSAGMGSYMAQYNLGVYYEISGRTKEAAACYNEASLHGYGKAKERLRNLQI